MNQVEKLPDKVCFFRHQEHWAERVRNLLPFQFQSKYFQLGSPTRNNLIKLIHMKKPNYCSKPYLLEKKNTGGWYGLKFAKPMICIGLMPLTRDLWDGAHEFGRGHPAFCISVQGELQQTNPGLTPTRVPFHFRPSGEQQFSGTCQSTGQCPLTILSQASFTSDWQQTLFLSSRKEVHLPLFHEQRNCLLPVLQSFSFLAASQKLSLQQTASATLPAQL